MESFPRSFLLSPAAIASVIWVSDYRPPDPALKYIDEKRGHFLEIGISGNPFLMQVCWIASMSFYANQMEHGNSTHSISSREGSATASGYVMESGFYITSFTATVFLAALITVGVLLITVMIALTVMLQSCQNKSSGLIQLERASRDYNYCKVFVLHAEINGLGAYQFPESCKAHAIQYIEEGQYLLELNLTIEMATSYFSNIKPKVDGLDVILMDIDDIFISILARHNYGYQHRFSLGQQDKQADAVKHPLHRALLALYMTLQADGWSVVFFTLKSEEKREDTVCTLSSAGYGGWSSLIMRSDDELGIESWEYLSTRRAELGRRGLRINSVISSHLYALTGPFLGNHNFKLPNLIYSQKEEHTSELSPQNTIMTNNLMVEK